MSPRALAVLATALAVPAVSATQNGGKAATAVRVITPPVIDGVLDDAAWREAPVVREFVQHDPVEGSVPSEPTEVRIVYDDDNLYIGAEMFDSRPQEIVRNVMVRQPRLFGEDRLHILFDTFYDRRNGYYFEVNPNGLRADVLVENNTTLLQDWDGIWFAETRVHERGWTVEIRIPFTTVSFDPQGGVWGLNFYRSIAGRREFISWNTMTRAEFPYAPALAGELRGLSGMRQGFGLDVIPSAVMRSAEDRVTGEETIEREPSLDVVYRLSQSSTLAATLNTDFAATNVDDRQVNLTRFSLFLPEKRLFFLQDAGIFEFGGLVDGNANGRPFFSRTIGLAAGGAPIDLQGGVKLTGREGRLNFGVLGVRQDETSVLEPRDLLVARAVANVFDESSIGLIATAGDPQSAADSRTYGGDFRYRDSDVLGGQALEASAWFLHGGTRGAQDADAFGGALRLPNDRWFAEVYAKELGSGFDPAMGFVNRPGIRDINGFFRFRSRPQDSYWLAHNWWLFVQRVTDLDGVPQSEVVEVMPWGPFSVDYDFYRPLAQRFRERATTDFLLFDRLQVPAGDYTYDHYSLRIESAEARVLRLYATVGRGGFFDGDRDNVSVDATWRALRRLTLDLDWEWNDVALPSGRYISRLYRAKASLALTPRLAWITLAQYDNVSEQLGLDLRLQWLPQAGQEAYLIYNTGSVRDPLTDRFDTTTREAVAKVVYTFRY